MATKKMDKKLVAYAQKYEVADLCALFKIKKKDFLEKVKLLPKRHSRLQVEALLLGAGYTKHPKKKKVPAKL